MTQAALFAPPVRYPCVFSDCGRYRYLLHNVLEPASGAGICLWIMANPSTADESSLDATLRRCESYTRAWGYAEMRVVNVRAWRATNPKDVPEGLEGVGHANDGWIARMAKEASLVVCGWGALGGERGARVLALLRGLRVTPHALRLTKSGAPGHPLYLPANLKPFPMGAA